LLLGLVCPGIVTERQDVHPCYTLSCLLSSYGAESRVVALIMTSALILVLMASSLVFPCLGLDLHGGFEAEADNSGQNVENNP